MADNNMNQNKTNEQPRNQADSNQTMRHEQAKGQVSGQRDRDEKSAIGGGSDRSQTGEPGRARNELEGGNNPTGQNREFDKNRSETAGSR